MTDNEIRELYTRLSQIETRVQICLSGDGDRHQVDHRYTLEHVAGELAGVLSGLYNQLPPFIEEK